MDNASPNPLIAWIQSSARRASSRAIATLEVLRSAQGDASWTVQSLPWQALEKPPLLQLLLDAGLSLDRIDPHPNHKGADLRRLAIELDAPLETHDILTMHGTPHVSEEVCGKLGANVVREGKVNSLRELHRSHPQFIEKCTREPPAILAIMILGRWLQSSNDKNLKMIEMANEWGADWDAMHKQQGFITAEKLPKFKAMVRDMQAKRLDKNSEQIEDVRSHRPRL